MAEPKDLLLKLSDIRYDLDDTNNQSFKGLWGHTSLEQYKLSTHEVKTWSAGTSEAEVPPGNNSLADSPQKSCYDI